MVIGSNKMNICERCPIRELNDSCSEQSAIKTRIETLNDDPNMIEQPRSADIMANTEVSSNIASIVANCIGKKLSDECVIVTPVIARYAVYGSSHTS